MNNRLTLSTLAVVLAVSGSALLASKLVKPTKPVIKTVQTEVLAQVDNKTQAITSPMKEISNLTVPREQVVVLAGEVGENALGISQEIMTKAQNGPVFLLISSPGGSVMDGAFIINAIEAAPNPVFTVCMDLCASMAAIIHQYGDRRLMSDRSILMFHDAAGGFQGYFPHVKSLFSTIERYIARFNTHIAKRANMSVAELDSAEHIQLWVDAEDAQGKFSDGIVYIQVMESRSKAADMRSLLRPATAPKADTTKPTKLLELYWIAK